MYWKSSVTTLALVTLLAACSNPSKTPDVSKDIKNLASIPTGSESTEKDRKLREGIGHLQKNDYERATIAFHTALNGSPNDSHLHFMAGLTSHLESKSGKQDSVSMAETAYKAAISNDPANKLASIQLARLYTETKRYAEAQDRYAEALLLAPGDAELLSGLATVSYMAQDIDTAYKTSLKAVKLRPTHQETLKTAALVHAAMGKDEEAQKYFGQYKLVADQRASNYVESRLGDWKRIHTGDRFTQLASLKDGPTHHVAPAAPNNMALVDVIILRTEESGTTESGKNVFKQLFAQIGNDSNPINWASRENKTKTLANFGGPIGTLAHTEQFTITKSFGLQAFNYALQIANTINKSSEVIARPTLVALDGKMSSFFSGNQLVVGLTGSIGGGQLDREKVGVHLEFIPKFLKDGRIEFAISVGRSFPETNLGEGMFRLSDSGGSSVEAGNSPFAATFQMAMGELSANVVMEFGQTLILAGLSERELIRSKEGFPVLKDIPILQYFFAENKEIDYHKHLVVMMTPRKPGFRSSAEDPVDAADKPRRHLDRFLLAYVGDVQMEPNMKHVFAGLEHNAFFKEFRAGDVTEDRWFHTKERNYLIDQTLDMLYF
jgi:tetratricopeptide (TPR) repeat protein